MTMSEKMLEVKNLNTFYGSIHAVKGISFEVNKGEIVTIIGNNGAGKSTTLNTVSGIVKAAQGSQIIFNGQDITKTAPADIVKAGLVLVPEGREVFPQMTVETNLLLGAFSRTDKENFGKSYERIYKLFPRLEERKKQAAGTLSGGEQQMLAIGRAMMSEPKMIAFDEPSLGLAPNIIKQIFSMIQEIRSQGISVLLIEQNANMALKIADRAYVLETGRITLTGDAKKLRKDDAIRKAYLGGK